MNSNSVNRRDILKLFGVGATIVPVVGGVPTNDLVKLVEPPKVELPPERAVMSVSARVLPAFSHEHEVTLFIKDKVDGSVLRMDCTAFMSAYEYISLTFTSMDEMRERIPSPTAQIKFVVTGPTPELVYTKRT